MRDFELCESAARSVVNGQFEQALAMLLKGCKAKPITFAIRCMDTHSELLGLGQAGQAQRFKYFIEAKAS